MRALIVDDSKILRKLVSRMLQEMGIEVAEAGHGGEALDYLRKSAQPDVALVDWNMPVMDGCEFVRAVRGNSAFDRMQIMMVTAQTEVTQVALALDAGANEYLMKPFDKEGLAEKLQLLGLLGAKA